MHALVRPRLHPGDAVALIAPAGPLASPDLLDAAVAQVESLGLRARPATHALGHHGFLAGTDAERLGDLNDALRDPAIRGIFALRGGYGTTRILDDIDYDALQREPKVVLGYSDLTAPLNAMVARSGVVTYHGPVAASPLTPAASTWLHAAIFAGDELGRLEAPKARTVRGGVARGRLAGGNLSLIVALLGTPFAIDFNGALAFIEEVDEAPYRVDRMLTHLRASGALRGCVGIIVGECRQCDSENAPHEGRLAHVLDDRLGDFGIPVIEGAPIGHIEEQWTLPLGVEAVLDADARTLDVD
jgi:muramoyltetrapeptide carboxypeptidase